MRADELLWKEDGLDKLESGAWTREKYVHLFHYMQLFSRGMKNLWEKRVYLDLYSGPGCCWLARTDKVYKGSPLLALSVQHPFDKYVFCEKNPSHLLALQKRISSLHTQAEIEYISGDCDDNVDFIISKLPMYSREMRVLTFCFVDPFDLSLHFRTIKKLAGARRIDFLVLLALAMDGNRNVKNYLNPKNEKIDMFLESPDWRQRWETVRLRDDSFQRFLANESEQKMLAIGYLRGKMNTKEFKIPGKNVALYHLAFFSKNKRGYDFMEKGVRSSDPQESLIFED